MLLLTIYGTVYEPVYVYEPVAHVLGVDIPLDVFFVYCKSKHVLLIANRSMLIGELNQRSRLEAASRLPAQVPSHTLW